MLRHLTLFLLFISGVKMIDDLLCEKNCYALYFGNILYCNFDDSRCFEIANIILDMCLDNCS